MANWQEVIFLIGNFVFAVALIPAVIGPHKPAFLTCLLTMWWLSLFVIGFVTLGLLIASIGTATTTVMWGILSVQTWRRK